MDQNTSERKRGKLLPIISIILGLLLASSLFPKYHIGEKFGAVQATFSLVMALVFIGWGILSFIKSSEENKYLKITRNIFRYIIWMIVIVLLIAVIPLIFLAFSGGGV